MNKLIFQEIPPEKREQHLDANCDEVLDGYEYLRELSEQEKTQEEEALAESSVKLMKLTEKLDKIKEDFKKQMKPLQIEIGQIVTILKDGGIKQSGNCYVIKDFTTNEVGIYNKEGILVSVPRKLKGSEVQSTIFNALREGTND